MIEPSLVFSDEKGNICIHPELGALGMKGSAFFRLDPCELIELPAGSTLFRLPFRMPVGFNAKSGAFIRLEDGQGLKDIGTISAVAAFMVPGYTITHCASYIEKGTPKPLPLYSYGAVSFYKGRFRVAAVLVDKAGRHDPRFINMGRVKKGIRAAKKLMRNNKLVGHLEKCALNNGCPGAQNLFMGREEGPLPASPFCNARCFGCISCQTEGHFSESQPRIKFIPTPEEIAEIALFHLERVPDSVVSFGQGCEGEPLLAADTIGKAIRLIRKNTSAGLINMNTNGSIPDALSKLCDAGLGSVRISMNSLRNNYYEKYYRPAGYGFKDVLGSLKAAKKAKAFISINYLTMPGFTDSKKEFAALTDFITRYDPDMIQWRNLNYDPQLYLKQMGESITKKDMIGISVIFGLLRDKFPGLMSGYYNPTKTVISNFRSSVKKPGGRNGDQSRKAK